MSDEPQPAQDFAAMTAPTAEHQMLQPFAGRFSAEVRIWMGPGDPMVSTGVMTSEFDLGGRFLRQTYVGDPSEGAFPEFEGRGYWGYNKVDQTWEGFWIDTASTVMQVDRGEVDGAGRVWTMVGQMTNPQSGEPLTKRSIITLVDEDHHRMEMFFDTPSGEARAMEISYARKT